MRNTITAAPNGSSVILLMLGSDWRRSYHRINRPLVQGGAGWHAFAAQQRLVGAED